MKFRLLSKAEEFSAGLLFVSGITVSLYGVFMRYVINKPPAWITEIFEFLMVWAIFIGFAMALRDNHHIAVELLYEKFPFRVKQIVNLFSNLIGAGFSIFLTVNGVKMVMIAYQQQIVTIDVGISIWITYLIMPVGTVLLAFRFIEKAYNTLRGDRVEIEGNLHHLDVTGDQGVHTEGFEKKAKGEGQGGIQA